MSDIVRAPAVLSSGVAAAVAAGSVVAAGAFSWSALGVGTAGLLVLAVGLQRGSNGAVTLGAATLAVGSFLAGIDGAPALPVLLGVTGAVLAWDVGTGAITLGNQLGRAAETRRLEAVHVTASAAVGTTTVGLGYGLFLAGSGGQPIAAVVFLLVAAVLLVVALR